jgi:hypothetical protein
MGPRCNGGLVRMLVSEDVMVGSIWFISFLLRVFWDDSKASGRL